MADPVLHIVSFDVPSPPNFGGVIDVYYKLVALHRAGVGIHLHCYTHRRPPDPALEALCLSVNYYPRKTGWRQILSSQPYIVAGRRSKELVSRLASDDYPILFEGLHTCALLADPALKGRKMYYRESNIEHDYYRHLANAERKVWKKVYFLTESLKLQRFQKILNHASAMLAVSRDDEASLRAWFPSVPVHYLPSFHSHDEPDPLPGTGSYALYHGKLSVPENSEAARYLVKEVWTGDLPGLVVAGLDPPGWLEQMIRSVPNVRLVANPDGEEMDRLIRNAHVNILVTFQPTGLKLKLLHALFIGRHCLVNPAMVAGTSLGPACRIAEGAEEFRKAVRNLAGMPFGAEETGRRRAILSENYLNEKNCKLLREIVHLH